MNLLRAYKTELDPNNKQKSWFVQCSGASRFVFNWALADRQHRHADGLSTSQYGQCKRFNALKREQCPWIVNLPYAIGESAFANCDSAFKHFFRRVKAGETPGYPKFKSRFKTKKSFQLRDTRIERNRVRLTGIGWVRLKECNYIPCTGTEGCSFGTYATISERAGRWYISVLVEQEIAEPENESTLVIGIDFGIKTLAVLSNGETFENPHPLRQAQAKLARLNRELARRVKGSANREKTKIKLQRAHADIANIRRHTLHNISHRVTAELRPARIVIEDLSPSNMVKLHTLAQAVSDVGFYELRRQIEYKAQQYGIEVIVADRWYASSKTCSGCGWKNDNLTLADRVFHCPECGLELDRDLNAALNLAGLAA